ncbi:MAG: hypothetical protein ACOC3Y_00270, partial [Desulfohalobiaceae bacterium]
MHKGIARRVIVVGLTIVFWTCGFWGPAWAEEEKQAQEMEEMVVREKANVQKIRFQPDRDIILVDEYEQPVIPKNMVDVIKDQPSIDFRGKTDLVPDDDTL